MAHILLVNPPGKCLIRKTDGAVAERKHCQPPLGLAYLVSACRDAGHTASTCDMLAEGYAQERLEEHFIIYGLTAEDLRRRVRETRPTAIGFSILFSHLASLVRDLIVEIRKEFPSMPVILGGHHPSAMAEASVRGLGADYVLIGEADSTLPRLLHALDGRASLETVPGLVYRAGDRVIVNGDTGPAIHEGATYRYVAAAHSPNPRDVDGVSWPAWDAFDMERYWATDVRMGGGHAMRKRYLVMVTSRGCPHACYFCTSPLMGGYKFFRRRSLDDVCAEIAWVRDRYQIEEIQFLDDNFFIDKARCKELLRRLASQFPEMVFSVPAGAEANALDDEVIELLAAAHFHRLIISFEAGDTDVQQDHVDKKVKLDRAPHIVEKCREMGIETRGYFMMGFPGETRQQIMRTVDLAMSLNLDDIALSVVTPLPGTPLHDRCVEEDLLSETFDPENIRYSVASIRLPEISGEELERIRLEYWTRYKAQQLAASSATAVDAHRVFRTVEDFSNAGFTSLPSPTDRGPDAPTPESR